MKKKIIICADDFAQSETISQGIIELAHKNRISAASCMTNTNCWPKQAKKISACNHIDIGLHLNLTHGKPLSDELNIFFKGRFASLSQLFLSICLKKLPKKALRDEIKAQLESFEQHLGKIPDFIDGHQHIHQLPLIRQALIEVFLTKYATLPFDKKPYVRVTISSPHLQQPFYIKKKIIQSLGAKTLKKALLENNIPHNKQYFYGIYPFTKNNFYPNVALPMLEEIGDGDLLMCHPGLTSSDTSDPIALHRHQEYLFLNSDEFYNQCKRNHLMICRFER